MPTLKELIDEINIGYACRALIGEGKGLFTMNEIKAEDPKYYEWLINEAKKRMGAKDGKLSEL